MNRIKDLFELGFLVIIVVACHVVKPRQSHNIPDFDKQGHRGSRGLMPENTIPAMIKAIELGVTTLEMDAVITKDKKVILSHEPFFNHEISTKMDGTFIDVAEEKKFNIFQMNFFETQQFDVGLKPHPRFSQQQKLRANKPLLSEVIDTVENYCRKQNKPFPFYNIETKSQAITDNIFHPAPDEFVKLVMQVINEKGIAGRVIIQSFDFRTLQVIHAKFPSIKTAALIEDYDKRTLNAHLEALNFVPDIYSPHYSLVIPELIQSCHEKKMKIIPWTVNDRNTIDTLRRLGVDGIITDYPNLFEK